MSFRRLPYMTSPDLALSLKLGQVRADQLHIDNEGTLPVDRIWLWLEPLPDASGRAAASRRPPPASARLEVCTGSTAEPKELELFGFRLRCARQPTLPIGPGSSLALELTVQAVADAGGVSVMCSYASFAPGDPPAVGFSRSTRLAIPQLVQPSLTCFNFDVLALPSGAGPTPRFLVAWDCANESNEAFQVRALQRGQTGEWLTATTASGSSCSDWNVLLQPYSVRRLAVCIDCFPAIEYMMLASEDDSLRDGLLEKLSARLCDQVRIAWILPSSGKSGHLPFPGDILRWHMLRTITCPPVLLSVTFAKGSPDDLPAFAPLVVRVTARNQSDGLLPAGSVGLSIFQDTEAGMLQAAGDACAWSGALQAAMSGLEPGTAHTHEVTLTFVRRGTFHLRLAYDCAPQDLPEAGASADGAEDVCAALPQPTIWGPQRYTISVH